MNQNRLLAVMCGPASPISRANFAASGERSEGCGLLQRSLLTLKRRGVLSVVIRGVYVWSLVFMLCGGYVRLVGWDAKIGDFDEGGSNIGMLGTMMLLRGWVMALTYTRFLSSFVRE
jgi:hypothetical protein